ncbi:MAG: valine--tRNA ligase [Candidatus Schekmanbacteria bacterium RBG_13_48_7]|uniref:Valine--tRNA ligase n=1 Tax=Candidatus Schekmanbacteria bacterium RBG_13_48_7 TaxID=1817878 RepID=A0A1F7RPT8_9BACT|nr:MAG: valine--tRNA ligase [Candidatus Schekmanbacteria bacterium RBG_13_48_7]
MNDQHSAYDPNQIEKAIYEDWEKSGDFHDEPDDRIPYCIVIPPPNVTGALHVGHALNNTIQDVLIRFYRMRGFNTLWLPGTDHAGVATQSVVERRLWESEHKTRHDLGRDVLIERIWRWKDEYETRILSQLKRLGCSCDWKRTRFTMDEGLSRAVREVFINLFKENLIYRGKRLINWCCQHRTALSNDELVYEPAKGQYWYIRYPVKGDSSQSIIVATTRPETMLGDTAVAVHSTDDRYKHLHGKTVILPLLEREIPVITDDELANPKKGTGAVKVTPAHDPNDYECGKRNDLQFISILNDDGTLNENAGPYAGLDRYEARKRVVEDLATRNLLVKVEDHEYEIAHCYRCHDIIEPYLSDQWFVKMAPLVELARQSVMDDEVIFFPQSRSKQFLDWLDTTPDWCISRQIWWGHRIPIWYCTVCNPDIKINEKGDILAIPGDAEPLVPDSSSINASVSQCPKCGNSKTVQDPDVLDTWFSSQLWPMSTLGWPDKTADLQYYYPTNVLVTARDIIALWVARMVMVGKKYIGKKPFSHVYIHGTILDEHGNIMSKSRGNGFDPIKMVDGGSEEIEDYRHDPPEKRMEHYKAYGADALRYGVMSLAAIGQDIRLIISRQKRDDDSYDVEVLRFEEGRRFCNKIWQVAHGVILQQCKNVKPVRNTSSYLEDRWLHHILAHGIENMQQAYTEYRMASACDHFYHLFWDNFCSWYVEIVKPRLWEGPEESADYARFHLVEALIIFLKLIHPIMPFISEELWRKLKPLAAQAGLKDIESSLIRAPWPDAGQFKKDDDTAQITETARAIAATINNIRSEHDAIGEHVKLPEVIITSSSSISIDPLRPYIKGLERFVKTNKIRIESDMIRPEQSAAGVVGNIEIFIPLAGLIDFEAEKQRLAKKISQAQADLEKILKKLSNPSFIDKAPAEIIEKEKIMRAELESVIEKLNQNLELIE